jgi:hypothetical protein
MFLCPQNADYLHSSSQRCAAVPRIAPEALLWKDCSSFRTFQSQLFLQVDLNACSPENSPEKAKPATKVAQNNVEEIIAKKISVEPVLT